MSEIKTPVRFDTDTWDIVDADDRRFASVWFEPAHGNEIATVLNDHASMRDKLERILIQVSEHNPFKEMFGEDAEMLIGQTPNDIWQMGHAACYQEFKRLLDREFSEAGR